MAVLLPRLPSRTYEHAMHRLVVDSVTLYRRRAALAHHHAVAVLVDLVLRDFAARLGARHVDARRVPAVDPIPFDQRPAIQL